MINKTFSELMSISSFLERFEYLKLGGKVGRETFGFDRYLNQLFYRTKEWQDIRDRVIIRDEGHDMGHREHPIPGRILIHHINPISKEDILNREPCVFDLENLISVSHTTHNAIHYGDSGLLRLDPVERFIGDTIPWR